MYPEQNQQPQIDKIDYLNQISAKPPKSNPLGADKRFLIIGGLVLIIIIVIIVAVISSGSRSTPNAELLGARLNGLSALIKYGDGNNITDATVKQMVAEVALLQSGDKKQLSNVFSGNQGFSKPSSQVVSQESTSNITKELDEAKNTGSINTLYKSYLIEKIESLITLLENTMTSVSSQTNKQIMQKTIDDFKLILDRFSD